MKRNLTILLSVFVVVSALSYWHVSGGQFADESFDTALTAGARLALLIYLLIFVARPLLQLKANSASRWLVANRRSLGVGFAAVMLSHLWFLIWKNGFAINVPGGLAYTFIVLMLVTSFDELARALGRERWRLLHKSGLYFLGIIFSATIVNGLRAESIEPYYLITAALVIGAVAIRVAAWMKRRRATAAA